MIAGRHIAIALVQFYRVVFSPLKGIFFGTQSCCRYLPSCSCYAMEAFRAHGVLYGSFLTVRRLLRCQPWGGSGFDPVPGARIETETIARLKPEPHD